MNTEPYLRESLNHLVNEVNTSQLKTIYSYTGDDTHTPIYYEEIGLFKKMIHEAGIQCSLVEIADRDFFPLNWDPMTSLIHIPGAMSSDLDHHLGLKIEEIREFVIRGGKFLGWCGGGYWACQKVQYRINEHTSMEKIRNLSFWKGIEKGPLLPFLGNPEGNIGFFHGAVKVKWKGSKPFQHYFPNGLEVNVLLSGGGFFIPSENEYPYKVIASYDEVENEKSYAGVKTYVGEGTAILINPYFTHGAEYFRSGLAGYQTHFPKHNWSKIVTDLEGAKLKSTLCFVDLFLEAISH